MNHDILKKLQLESGDPIIHINKFLVDNKVSFSIDKEIEKPLILAQ